MKMVKHTLCIFAIISHAHCSISSPISFTEVWPGNAKGHITILPSIPIDGWSAHLHFDQYPSNIEVYTASVTKTNGQEYLLQNLNYDGHLNAGQALTVEFIVRGIHTDQPTGRYYVTMNPSAGAFTDAPKPSNTMTTTTPTPTSSTKQSSTSSATFVFYTATHSTFSKQPSTTATRELNKFACDHLSTMIALANHAHLDNDEANTCTSGSQGSNEELVLSLCNVDKPATWRRGAQVMSMCDKLPEYTPIATFSLAPEGKYVPNGAQSGIFAGCSENGFLMIVQHCNGSAVIEGVRGGLFLKDPFSYYVIN